jgi:hypothetical protein
MTAPSYCVLDGTTGVAPARPDALCEAMGGLQFQDDVENPPRTHEHISSKDFMQQSMLIERLCRMMPVLVVEFTATTGDITAKNIVSAVDSLTAANVTVDWAGGETYLVVSWPASSLPAKTREPIATPRTNASARAACVQLSNSVSVTQAEIGAGSYVVEIFGE